MKILAALAATLSLHAAMVDGAKINYTVAGKGDKTVVFIHGWTCDLSTWSKQIPAVARKHQAVAIDLPGHGKSGMPKSAFSMDLFAKAIEGVRREIHADKMILVGHSMGTPAIRQYARLFPQHVAALVLVDGPMIDPAAVPAFAGLGERFKGPDVGKTRLEFIRGMFTPMTTPELRARIEKMMTAPPDATAAGAMTAMADPAIWKQDSISVPVLGIYAEKSRAANRELLSKAFPSIEYTEIPGTDHFLMLEKPEEFNRILMEFVDKQ